MRSSLKSISLLSLLLVIVFAGCSDSTAPKLAEPVDGGAQFDGSFDSAGGSFVMQRIEEPLPDHRLLQIELVGSNVQVDPQRETVSLDVAIRNLGPDALYAPATIWLARFVPPGVVPLNADFSQQPVDSILTAPSLARYGYDYSELLGGDGMLAPNELSQAKSWEFLDPQLQSFSFSARAEFGLEPGHPVIAGVVFSDDNRNGIHDEGEGPYSAGGVVIETPSGDQLSAPLQAGGSYRVPVTEAGLYKARFVSMLACFACWCETTENPLNVFISPGPNGQLSSFEHADFGIYPGPCSDPLPQAYPTVLTDQSPDAIDQDSYQAISAQIVGNTFTLRVGYSGCSADHPFTLQVGRTFAKSDPPQTWMLLQHDDRGEACRAYFQRTLSFDLLPIQFALIEDFGAPSKVQLRFRDFTGAETGFTYDPVVLSLQGTVTAIDDQVPVDGGVVIDLKLDSGETAQLHFGSLFTYPPSPSWRTELYQVIAGLEVGNHVTAKGLLAKEGIQLVGLTIDDSQLK